MAKASFLSDNSETGFQCSPAQASLRDELKLNPLFDFDQYALKELVECNLWKSIRNHPNTFQSIICHHLKNWKTEQAK